MIGIKEDVFDLKNNVVFASYWASNTNGDAAGAFYSEGNPGELVEGIIDNVKDNIGEYLDDAEKYIDQLEDSAIAWIDEQIAEGNINEDDLPNSVQKFLDSH